MIRKKLKLDAEVVLQEQIRCTLESREAKVTDRSIMLVWKQLLSGMPGWVTDTVDVLIEEGHIATKYGI